jgi:hypothetical protein
MKKMNLKKLAVMGLTAGLALTAQGAFAETSSTNGTVLAAGCASCGGKGFGASTKANHERDSDDSDDSDLADNTGAGPTTIPVQPVAPAPQTYPNSNVDNANRFNTSGQYNQQGQFNSQSNQTSSGQRRVDDQGMQRRLPVDSK